MRFEEGKKMGNVFMQNVVVFSQMKVWQVTSNCGTFKIVYKVEKFGNELATKNLLHSCLSQNISYWFNVNFWSTN